MSFYHVIKTFKMFYKLLIYLFGLVTFFMNVLWFCCTIASAAIPWLTLLFIIVCVLSKFVKLKSPNYGCKLSMLGPDPNKIIEDNIKCGYLYWAIANRGGSYDAPENSVEAIKKCASQNCRSILLDLAITECEELVLLHKSTLLKANIAHPITKIKYEHLQNINISEHHPLSQQFPPEKIITLANLLTVVDTDDSKTIFLLLSNSNAKMISILKDFIDKNEFDFMKRFIVCSSSPLAIYQLRKSFPNLLCGLWMQKSTITNRHRLFKISALIKPIYGALLRYIIAPVIGICVVFIHKEEFNLHVSNLWRNVGVRPIVYPVNSPNEKRYYQQVTQTQYLTDSLRSEPQLLLMDKLQNHFTNT